MANNHSNLKTRIIFIALGALLLVPLPILAAAPEITTRVSSQEIYLSDEVVVEIDVVNAETEPKIELPASKDMTFESTESQISSSSTTIINGKVNKIEIRTFQIKVVPKRAGDLSIPPISLVVGKKTYRTSAIALQVDPPPLSDDMHIEVKPSSKEVFENETVIFHINWYLQVNLEDYDFLFPPITDKEHWSFEDQQKSKSGTLSVQGERFPFEKSQVYKNGQYYTLYSLDIPLRATKAGNITIAPTVVSGIFEKSYTQRLDIFGRPIKVPKYEKVFAANDSFTVRVKALPPSPKGKEYYGVVGDFRISAFTDAKKASVGDSILYKLEIKGNGYLGGLPENFLQNSPDFSSKFDITLKETKNRDDSGKIFNYYITPKSTTIKSIPEVALLFFNPEDEKYNLTSSQEFKLEVEEAKILSSADIFVSQNHVARKKSEEPADVLISEKASAFDDMPEPFAESGQFKYIALMTLTLPFFGLLFAFGARHVKSALAQPKQVALPMKPIEAYIQELDALQKLTNETDTSSRILALIDAFVLEYGHEIKLGASFDINTALPSTSSANPNSHQSEAETSLTEINRVRSYIMYAGASQQTLLVFRLADLARKLFSCASHPSVSA